MPISSPLSHEAYHDAASRYEAELHRAAMRLTRSGSDADDLLQDTLTRAYCFWERFEQGTNVRAWLHRILLNTFINGYRRRQRERDAMRRAQDALTPVSAPPQVPGEMLGDEVLEAMRSLRPEYCHAVVMVDMLGLSYAEAADAAACPIGTIMSRLHRGRKTLQDRLRTYAADQGYLAAA